MRSRLAVSGLSLTGMLLFVIGLAVVGSGFLSLRPMVGGLALHPYLIPLGAAFPLVFLARISQFPVLVMAALLVFYGMCCFSVLSGGGIAFGEVFKIICSLMTIVTCALLVRKRGDFVAGAMGLSLAVALLAANGIQAAGKEVDAIEGANRNSYSLFALPALLLAGFICIRLDTVPKVVKTFLIVCSIVTLLAIFMGANRSGYLGAFVVALMLFWDRRGKGLLLVAMVAGIVAGIMVQYGRTHVLDERLKQTVEGNKSDEHRIEIIKACIEIGVENPLVGVSPQMLPTEIGRHMSVASHMVWVEAHNVFAHIIAASGFICLLSLFAVGYTMWAWRPRGGGTIGGKDDPLYDPRSLMRMMVVLWVVRGMFTREIMFSPSFNIALGLIIGYCMLGEVARAKLKTSKATTAAGPGPQGAIPGLAR